MGTVPAGREKRAGTAGGRQTFRSPIAVVVWWVWLLFAVANVIDLALQGRDHGSLVAAAILVLGTGIAYVTAQRPRIIADDAGITIRNPLRDHHIGWAGVIKIDLADLLRVHARTSQPGQVGQVGQVGQADQQTKVIGAWAVHYSRRRQLAAETRMRRAAARSSARRSSPGLPYGSRGYGLGGYAPPASQAEAEAEKIVRQLSERATAARAEEVWAEGIQGAVPIAGPQAASPAGQTTPRADQARLDLTGTGWLDPLKSTWSRSAIAALVIPALILLIVTLI